MSQPTKHHLLSKAASNRATAYSVSNKSVTLAGKTHVVWTDTVAITCGRTFDHATGQWGETMRIGEGCDNHNNPTLTADAKGHLHIAYGPHGIWDHANRICDWPPGTFKHAVSSEPNSLVGLEKCSGAFGYHGTYAALLHVPPGRDCIVYRGGEDPPSLMFQCRTSQGGWSNARALMAQDVAPGYTYYGAQLTCDRQGTIYVGGLFYSTEKKGSVGVAVLQSKDLGETWTSLRGDAAAVPIRYGPAYAVPHPEVRTSPYLNGLVVDSRGTPWVLTSGANQNDRQLLLSRWDGRDWKTLDISAFLPKNRVTCGSCAASMTIDARDRIHIALQAARLDLIAKEDSANAWGDPSTEVFHLVSRDGGKTFECTQITPTDPQVFTGLPIISKSGPFHPVEQPVILYTRGSLAAGKGEGCNATGLNEVHAVFVDG